MTGQHFGNYVVIALPAVFAEGKTACVPPGVSGAVKHELVMPNQIEPGNPFGILTRDVPGKRAFSFEIHPQMVRLSTVQVPYQRVVPAFSISSAARP